MVVCLFVLCIVRGVEAGFMYTVDDVDSLYSGPYLLIKDHVLIYAWANALMLRACRHCFLLPRFIVYD